MADIDNLNLPSDVIAKLAELDLELSEGDITQQGYEKKRMKLLAPFTSNQRPVPPIHPSPSTAAQRKAQRKLTRVDNRYHSEIRKEAVMQALAMNKKQSMAPMPSKRTSAIYHPQPLQRREHATDSSSDDDSVMDEDSSREHLPARHGGLIQSGAHQPNLKQSESSSGMAGKATKGSIIYQNVNNPQGSNRGDVDVLQKSRPQCMGFTCLAEFYDQHTRTV